MLRVYKLSIISLYLIMLTSCGGEEKNSSPQSMESKTVEINLTANDKMQYNINKIAVNEGDLVKIKLTNIGRMPKEVMGHNFVLLLPKVNPAQFATKALSAKENSYIPHDELENIIVYSKLLGPSEETIIEFTAPAKGTYKYICSFPGHYITMQGNLIVM